MNEKIKEHVDIPIYVYLHEDVIPEEAILLMIFYNGMTDAFDALISYLDDATDIYLEGVIVTVIEDDPLD